MAYVVSQDRPGAPSKAPAYSFGVRPPSSIKETVKNGVLLHDNTVDVQPGPGQYRVERKVGADSPAFSLGGRYNSAGTRGQSPGPAYDPNFRFTSPRKRDPAYTFGVRPSSGRPQSATIPGPGAYDPSLRRGAPAFSLGARNDRDNKDATLGPTVVHEPHFGPPAGYTFGTRSAADGALNTGAEAPGPGQYSSSPRSVLPTAPAYSLGGRVTRTNRDQSPGPGQYDVRKRPGTAGVVFGTGGRGKLEGNDAPGPGQYTVNKKWDGPAASIKGRNELRSAGTSPGPAYDPNYRVQSPRKRDPAFSFGSSTRPADGTGSVAPGPGAYDPNRGKTAPAFSLGARIDHDGTTITPGPVVVHDPQFGPGKGFTFGVKNDKEGGALDQKPGPGQYDVKPKREGPAFSLIGRTGAGGKGDNMPGPGQYDVTKRPKSAGVVFGTGGRSKLEGNDAPGPGQYSVNKRWDGPAASIKGRTELRSAGTSPGPAYDPNYRVQSPRKRDPAFSFGSSTRPADGTGSVAPGPGAYNPARGKTAPAFSLGQRLDHDGTTVTPGPAVIHDPQFGPGKGFTFGVKNDKEGGALDQKPGPGQYDVKPKRDGPAFSLLGRNEGSPNRDNMPGPGQYDISKRPATAGIVFGTGGRSKLEGNDAPGPGQYAVNKKWDGPAASIKGRNELRSAGTSPGPAYDPNYRVQSPRKRDPAFSFGSSTRPADGTGSIAPGPGAYNPARGKTAPAFTLGARIDHDGTTITPGPVVVHDPQFGPGKGFTFGVKNEKEGGATDQKPGPGQYDVRPRKDGPAFSLSGRENRSPGRDGVPGPGQYDVTPRPASAGIVFGTGGRAKLEGNDAPGPGQYAVNKKWDGPAASIKGRNDPRTTTTSPGPAYDPNYRVQSPRKRDPAFSFGSSTRPADGTGSVAPGPGAYDPARGKTAPAFTLGARIDHDGTTITPGPVVVHDPQFGPGKGYTFGVKNDKEGGALDQKPGPGQYDVKPKRDGPAFSLLGRNEGSPNRDTMPGPGQYDISARPTTAGIVFGSGGRAKLEGNDAPGPGQYAVNKKWDGPAVSIKGRNEQRTTTTSPGPAYDPNYRVQSPRKRDPAFSFGSSTRPADGTGSVAPGPGAYDPNRGRSNPAFSLGQRLDHDAKDTTPGPGVIHDPQFGPGKGFTFGVRTELEATVKNDVVLLGGGGDQKPGPGAYNASPKRGGPAFSILGREHGGRTDALPGPGQYDVGFSWPAKGWGGLGATL